MDYDTLKKFSLKNNKFVFTMVLYYIVFEKSCSKRYYKFFHRNINLSNFLNGGARSLGGTSSASYGYE